jgi:hypothetical protein
LRGTLLNGAPAWRRTGEYRDRGEKHVSCARLCRLVVSAIGG